MLIVLLPVNRKLLFKIRAELREREAVSWLEMSEQEKIFHCAWEFFSEVNSGGIHRYFFYHGADHAHEAVTALKALGFVDIAKILSEIVSDFPGGNVPNNISERQSLMGSWPKDQIFGWEDLARPVYAINPEPALWHFYQANERNFRKR